MQKQSKSSIHVKPVKSNSEKHNTRATTLDYIYNDLTKNNESWIEEKIRPRLKKIQESCKKISGRKLQKNATPIREALVNLLPHHKMADVKKMAYALERKFKIKAFQIHIHNDEGKSKTDLNHHAHIVFDWQDKNKGSMLRLNSLNTSQIQTLVAKELGMERGKEGSKSERLEAQVYKQTQEIKKLTKELKSVDLELGQKKSLLILQKEFSLNKEELDFCKSSLQIQEKSRKQLKDTRQKLEQQESKNYQLRAPLEQLRNRLKPHCQKLKELRTKLIESKKILEKKKILSIKLKNKLQNLLKPNSKSLALAQKHRNPKRKKMRLGR